MPHASPARPHAFPSPLPLALLCRSWWVPLDAEALREGANMLSVVLQPAAAMAARAQAAYPYPVPTMQVCACVLAADKQYLIQWRWWHGLLHSAAPTRTCWVLCRRVIHLFLCA